MGAFGDADMFAKPKPVVNKFKEEQDRRKKMAREAAAIAAKKAAIVPALPPMNPPETQLAKISSRRPTEREAPSY